MESILSIIATILSSVALIGVTVGLILQSRQLRANQIQIVREMQLELMKIGMENPSLTASVYEDVGSEDSAKNSLVNFIMKFWETGYSLKILTKDSVALQAMRLFSSAYPRTWWATMHSIYEAEAGTKSEREFFMLVDGAFRSATEALQTANQQSREHRLDGEQGS